MTDRRRTLLIALGGLIVLLLVLGLWLGSRAKAPDRDQPTPESSRSSSAPAGGVDLAGWKLTLPTANDEGNAASVDPAQVTPPWLNRNDDGSLTFWAPVRGATTKNSSHPRTELINLTDFTAGDSGTHTLQASLAVTQVPRDTKDVIVGQIHGSDDIKSIAFVMLHYREGEINVVVKQRRERGGTAVIDYPLIDGVDLGQRFDITMSDGGDGTMTFSATSGGSTKRVTAPVPEAFAGQTVRFQAGDYQQSDQNRSSPGDAASPGGGTDTAGGGGAEGGRVTFYQLSTQP